MLLLLVLQCCKIFCTLSLWNWLTMYLCVNFSNFRRERFRISSLFFPFLCALRNYSDGVRQQGIVMVAAPWFGNKILSQWLIWGAASLNLLRICRWAFSKCLEMFIIAGNDLDRSTVLAVCLMIYGLGHALARGTWLTFYEVHFTFELILILDHIRKVKVFHLSFENSFMVALMLNLFLQVLNFML